MLLPLLPDIPLFIMHTLLLFINSHTAQIFLFNFVPVSWASSKDAIAISGVNVDYSAVFLYNESPSFETKGEMTGMAEILDVLRTEHKYPLTAFEAEVLRMRLSAILTPDPHSKGRDGYLVRSLYFDSFDNKDFFEKQAGIEYRKKIRLRSYGDGGILKLETKQKQGSLQRKLSLSVSRQEAEAMIAGDYAFLLRRADPLAHQLYAEMAAHVYLPRCVVDYHRFAFIAPANDTRITFDSCLSGSESDFDIFSDSLQLFPVPPLGGVTLEVKYNRFLLSYVKDALSLDGHPERASSKYCAVRTYSLGGLSL